MNLEILKQEQVALINHWRLSVRDWGLYTDLAGYKPKDLVDYENRVHELYLAIVRLQALYQVGE